MTINGVLIKSDRAIEAEEENRFPLTEAKRQLRKQLSELGIQSTHFGCEQLLRKRGYTGEWHHVSKFARRIDYFDVGAVVNLFVKTPSAELSALAVARKPRVKVPDAQEVRIKAKWRQHSSARNFRIQRYEGPATIRGDWIAFDGRRKRLSGKFFDYQSL